MKWEELTTENIYRLKRGDRIRYSAGKKTYRANFHRLEGNKIFIKDEYGEGFLYTTNVQNYDTMVIFEDIIVKIPEELFDI